MMPNSFYREMFIVLFVFINITSAQTSLQKDDLNKKSDPWVLWDGKLRLSFQERVRGEIRENNFDFDSSRNAVTDDLFLLQRFRLGITAQPADGMTLMFEGQDSHEFDSKRPNIPGILGADGDDEFDLRQGWILLGDPKEFPISLKVGRMTWKHGDERLIGDFDWNNLGRTFDGIVARTEFQSSWVDLIFGSPVLLKPNEFNSSDGHDRLLGIYFSTTQWFKQTTECYLLYRNHNNAVNNGQPQETGTPGVRVKSLPGNEGRWDYELEVAGQAVEASPQPQPTRSLDHYAFASHLERGYTWLDLECKPRVSGFYDFATGDSDPADQEDTGLQNLFPTNHKFYGSMELFSWRNIHDFGASFAAKPHKDLLTKFEAHSFWLSESEDAWYRANGFTTIRPSAAGRNVDSHVGEEIDITLILKVNRLVSLNMGYGHFFPGSFVNSTGPSSDAEFFYEMLVVGF
jgi:hypothetical protein